jgi:tRNA-5-taurinomethyluridine 2-sulfurtransferase
MKIAVLTSGGVDSSVALKLLKEEGHDITAFYLKIWLQEEFSFLGDCPWEEDLNFVKEICSHEKIPLEVLSLQTEYWDTVVSYTITEIKNGRTPNPDIYCNSLIKFGQFYEKISPEFEKVASGHYAAVEEMVNRFYLKRAPDPVKDQTYFLAYLSQAQLSRACFPIGKYNKSDVRDIARRYNLASQARKDSQGICFLGQIKFNEFVKHHLGEIKGDMVDMTTGRKMGEHPGYYYYTIGQRSGLGLGGGPWYVVKKDIENNIIYISTENPTARERTVFTVGNFNWIAGKPEKKSLLVKIRHGASFYNCSLEFDGKDNKAIVTLDKGDKGIAPGQFAVFYDGEYCLGGSVILE